MLLHALLDASSSAAVSPPVVMGLELVDVIRSHNSPTLTTRPPPSGGPPGVDKGLVTTLLSAAQSGCSMAGRSVKCGLMLLQALSALELHPDKAACDKLIRAAAASQNKTLSCAFQVSDTLDTSAGAARTKLASQL